MAISLILDGQTHRIEILRRRPRLVLSVDGTPVEVGALPEPGSGARSLILDGRTVPVLRAGDGAPWHLRLGGRSYLVTHVDPLDGAGRGGAHADQIVAPMPGAVVSVDARPGDRITRGDTVMTIESMKLQTALVAPRDGVVAQILCEPGEIFDKDAVVALLEPLQE